MPNLKREVEYIPTFDNSLHDRISEYVSQQDMGSNMSSGFNHTSFGAGNSSMGSKNNHNDPLSTAQQKVNQTKMQMEMNVRKMIEN